MAGRGTNKNQPSAQRYKAENKLQKNKIRRIMAAQSLTEKEALDYWEESKRKKS